MTRPWDGRHVVYRIFNARGACIYIGCTKHFTSRMYDHRMSSYFAADIARVRVTIHRNRETALAIEQAEISRTRPRHNINGRGRRGFWNAVDYIEVLEAVNARIEHGSAQRSTPQHASHLDPTRIKAEFGRRFPEIAALIAAGRLEASA